MIVDLELNETIAGNLVPGGRKMKEETKDEFMEDNDDEENKIIRE